MTNAQAPPRKLRGTSRLEAVRWRFAAMCMFPFTIAAVIRTLAVASGLLVILLPLTSLLRTSRRTKGRKIGSGSALRRWPAVGAMTLGFIASGVLFWKPLPIEISGSLDCGLLVLGSLMYFPSIILYLWGLVTLGKEFGVSTFGGAEIYADHRFVKSGPYRLVRHPMYLGVLVAAIGALLIFRTWAMAFFAPMSLVVIRRAHQEEKLMEAEYGEEWQAYKERVPMWILWRFRNKDAI